MTKFIPEGTDPDGPSGMYNREAVHVEGGKPDVYLDIDTVEDTPVMHIDLVSEQPEDLEIRQR